MSSILITGATGQVGQWLEKLAPKDAVLITPSRNNFDLSQPANLSEKLHAISPGAIINSGAYTNVDGAETHQDDAFRVNAEGPEIIADYAAKRNIPLIHLSTDFVFDGSKNTPYIPTDTPDPLCIYGASKLAGEERVTAANAAATVVRTSWVYSESGSNFVLKILELAANRPALTVVTDQSGTPCYARNLAKAIWQLLETPHQPGIYHYADRGCVSRYDFARAIVDEAVAAGLLNNATDISGCASSEFPAPAKRPAYSALDAAGIESILQTKSQHWRDALKDMLRSLAAMQKNI